VRHVTLAEAKALYRSHRYEMLRGGLMLALIFVIPVVNLFAPLLATAWMVHRVWRREGAPLRARQVIE
jgi:CysZ protein